MAPVGHSPSGKTKAADGLQPCSLLEMLSLTGFVNVAAPNLSSWPVGNHWRPAQAMIAFEVQSRQPAGMQQQQDVQQKADARHKHDWEAAPLQDHYQGFQADRMHFFDEDDNPHAVPCDTADSSDS